VPEIPIASRSRCADIGLTLSTGIVNEAGETVSKDKCELILTGGAASTVDVATFPADFKIARDGNFELLGGPVGTPEVRAPLLPLLHRLLPDQARGHLPGPHGRAHHWRDRDELAP